jgi:UDP-glucose 4-epimerase
MRHLITGGAGFIGSHLAEHLLRRGDRVVALDDLSTGSHQNIDHLPATGRFTFVQGSVLDWPLVDELVAAADDVYHLAAAVGVRLIIERRVQSLVTNTLGTEHVLRAAEKHRKPVLITSSSEVYGTSDAIPFREDAGVALGSTMRPRWGYGCTKAFDEFLAFAYAQERGLRVVVARLFNTVGPRQTGQFGMVVPRFVRQALAGESITVWGNGTQTRCFTWVGDVVEALPRLLEEPNAWGTVVNIGSAEEVTVRDLAERVRARTASASPIQMVPYAEALGANFDDMYRRVPSLERARSLIGYQPSLGIDRILDKIIEHERETAMSERRKANTHAVP